MAKYIKKGSFVIKPTNFVVSRGRNLPGMRYLTLPKSSIYSQPSLVLDSPAANRYPDSPAANYYPDFSLPPNIDEATRPPIHVKMEYLGDGSPQGSFLSGDTRNGHVVRQTNNNSQYDSSNSTPRVDNQNDDLHIELPTDTTLVNQSNGAEASSNAAAPKEPGALQSDLDGPAVIVPEEITERTSGTGHLSPGDPPDDYSALFIK